MNKGKTVLVLLLLAVLSLPVRTAAQRRTFVEWGVLGGLNFSDFSSKDKSFDVSNKLGFQAGISIGVNLGLVAIQPEILFVRQTFGVEHADIGRVKVKSNSIDVPVLLSVRVLKPLRINVGPVFSVMNDCKYKWGSDLIDFGRARPTVSYTPGVGVGARAQLPDRLPIQRAVHLQKDLLHRGCRAHRSEILLRGGEHRLCLLTV